MGRAGSHTIYDQWEGLNYMVSNTGQGAVTPSWQAGAANPGLLAEVHHTWLEKHRQTRSTILVN